MEEKKDINCYKPYQTMFSKVQRFSRLFRSRWTCGIKQPFIYLFLY